MSRSRPSRSPAVRRGADPSQNFAICFHCNQSTDALIVLKRFVGSLLHFFVDRQNGIVSLFWFLIRDLFAVNVRGRGGRFAAKGIDLLKLNSIDTPNFAFKNFFETIFTDDVALIK